MRVSFFVENYEFCCYYYCYKLLVLLGILMLLLDIICLYLRCCLLALILLLMVVIVLYSFCCFFVGTSALNVYCFIFILLSCISVFHSLSLKVTYIHLRWNGHFPGTWTSSFSPTHLHSVSLWVNQVLLRYFTSSSYPCPYLCCIFPTHTFPNSVTLSLFIHTHTHIHTRTQTH